MSLPIVWRPEAEADLLAARDWYEWQRSGLGEEFADAVETMLARIEAMPELYAIALQAVRRGRLRDFLTSSIIEFSQIILKSLQSCTVVATQRFGKTESDA